MVNSFWEIIFAGSVEDLISRKHTVSLSRSFLLVPNKDQSFLFRNNKKKKLLIEIKHCERVQR